MRHPYADFIHRVEKPARYLGGEFQSVRKDPAAVEVSMALAFPDLYDIGMSHLGTKILYSVLNKDPRIAAERAFAPWPDLERELRERNLPLVTLESARPLRDFDVVGFSLQYELTYTNVLLMLELGGIPLRASERGEDQPLVIAGGPTATHPEAVAPFFDAIVVGDGEEKLPELLLRWKEWRRAGMARSAALIELAQLGGIYVPALYSTTADPTTGFVVVEAARDPRVPLPVKRALVEDINKYPFPDDSPVPEAEAIFDRMAVEVARGCTEGCRFCQAGMIYRPVRERDPRQIVDAVLGAVEKGGYDEVSLTALSTADVSCIAPLVEKVSKELARRKVSMSVSSLRAYGLPPAVLDDISQVRASGLTFAPEAGTQRMRDVISKNVSEEDMVATAHRVFSRDWQKPKLYFMIGLPTETDEDVRGIVETGRKVRGVGLEYHAKSRVDVTVSVSTHVPKPHTPFQWCAMDGPEEIARKQALLAESARETRLTLKMHDSRGSWLEGVLGRGDRRLADVVEQAYRNGARFDGWDEHLRFEIWQAAIAEHGIDPAPFLGTIPVSARLPWDHIDVGLADGFLLKEYRKALAGRLSPPCGKPVHAKVHHTNLAEAEADRKLLVCYDCGVACDLTRMREERIEFLQVLGAKSPRPGAPEVDPGAKERKQRKGVPQPKAKFDQRQPVRYRVAFTKLGRMAVTGHLDLVRLLPRILRRAGLDVYYSVGFHPHPVLSFGPALALGIASLAEYAEFALAEDREAVDVLTRLGQAAQEGIEFTGVRKVEAGEPSLAKAIAFADWAVSMPAGVAIDPAWPGLELVVERKGEQRRVVLAEAIVDARPLATSQVPLELGLPPGGWWLFLRTRIDGGLKPAEAVRALTGVAVEPVAIGRVGLWSEALADPLGGPMGELRERPDAIVERPSSRPRRLPLVGSAAAI